MVYQVQSATISPGNEDWLETCLQRHWIHSHEEDTETATVYRPADFSFPPSRGRTGYEFLAGGELIYHGIGPADGPLVAQGRWEMIAGNQVTIDVDEPGAEVSKTWRILSCTAERLNIARSSR